MESVQLIYVLLIYSMDLLKKGVKTVGKDIKVGKQLVKSGKRIYDAQAERSSIKKKYTAVGKTIKPKKIGNYLIVLLIANLILILVS